MSPKPNAVLIADYMLHRYIIFLAIPVAFSSCEDKGLVQKEEGLNRQITDLETQFEVMKTKAKEDLKKQSDLLDSINQKFAEVSAERLVTVEEYKELEQSYDEINQAYLNFKETNQIKEEQNN